jgi:membrane protein DedA with SNARE-associated domain
VLKALETALIMTINGWYLHTGLFGVAMAMAIESCCIPLPSEIVMPLAGYFVYARPSQFSLVGVALAGALGCTIGSAAAYGIGAAGGRPLLLKYGRYILVSHADSDRADRWFARYGAPVAFFGRLLPVVRTFISLPAGISRTPFVTFLVYSFLGSFLWSLGLAYVGMRLGPAVGKDPAVLPDKLSSIFHGLDAVIIVAFLVLVGLYIYRHIKHDQAARAAAARNLSRRQPVR